MEADLRALLLAQSALTSAVGQRISWDGFPQGAADLAVRLSLINNAEGLTMQGGDGLSQALVQVSIRGKIITEAWAARDAVQALHGYRGTVAGTYFNLIEAVGRSVPREFTGTDQYFYRVVDLNIWHKAAS